MTDNIFKKGCLVQLSISRWGGIKQIRKNSLARMVKNTDHSWLTASKKLVEPQSLKPVCKVSTSARTWLITKSLPFPVNSMVFIPRELLSEVDEKLDGFKNSFDVAVSDFASDYTTLRDNAREYLGSLFNEVDYPMDIISKFRFNWRFIILDIPNGRSRLLSPELYAREAEKFKKTMEEARIMAIEALREEFAQMVEHITDRFTDDGDKPKVFRNSTVDSFYDYFNSFRERNIFEDGQLEELVSRAQAVLGGSSVERIRSDNRLKNSIRSGMVDIENAIEAVFNRPRRKIIMD